MSVQWTVAEGEMRRTSQAKRAEGTAVPPAKIELADESRHFDIRNPLQINGLRFFCCLRTHICTHNRFQNCTPQISRHLFFSLENSDIFDLHRCNEIFHFIGHILLHFVTDMSVNIQSECNRSMTQRHGQCFYIHLFLYRECGIGVPGIV